MRSLSQRPLMPHPASRRPPRFPPSGDGPARPRAVGGRPGRARGAARLAVLLAAPVAAGLAGCGGTDPFAIRATLSTTLDTLVVFPLTGSSPLLPAAIDLLGRRAVRPALRGAAINFDIAFDRDAGGIVLYPPRTIAAPLAPVPRTAFQLPAGTNFDALTIASTAGYDTVASLRVTPGRLVTIQGQGVGSNGPVCAQSTRFLYAKLVVDSVSAATGGIHLRVRTNPNCGFRSFAPGVPTD